MPIDINLMRVDKGGDPELVKASQRKRNADESVVDRVIAMDGIARKAKFDRDGLNK